MSRLRRRIAPLLLAALCLCGCGQPPMYTPGSVAAIGIRPGDVLFQTRAGFPYTMLADMAQSPYNHCGLVIEERDRSMWVLDATPAGVRRSPLTAWLECGRDGRLTVYRFSEAFQPRMLPLILTCATAYEGRPYDPVYRLDDHGEFIYSSELLYRAVFDATGQRLGQTVPLMDLAWQSWRSEVQTWAREIPVQRQILPIPALMRTRQLHRIWSNYGISTEGLHRRDN